MEAKHTNHFINALLNRLIYKEDTFESRASIRAHAEASEKELNELERLAKIGEATEKMFDDCQEVTMIDIEEMSDGAYETVPKELFSCVEDLLRWSEGVEE